MAQLEHIEAIEKRLWSAADTLRANSNCASNEYFLSVMGLVFLRHAYSRYLGVKDGIKVHYENLGGAVEPFLKTLAKDAPHTVRAIHESPQRNRRSIRLHGYDYSMAGAYFVTVCTQNRECLFGKIVDGEMNLNEYGNIVAGEWIKTAEIRDEIELDEFVVMPNHFHGILVLTANVGAIHESPLHMTVSQRRNMAVPKIIGRFKMLSSKHLNELRQTPGAKMWQRNYYEHIVRNDDELNRIREYIAKNPAQWETDKLHPSSLYGRFMNRPFGWNNR